MHVYKNEVRLSPPERKALKTALDGFSGEVYVFGSRVDLDKRGGDIDILLKPKKTSNVLGLKSRIQSRFMKALEQSLDVVVYKKEDLFCKEIIKYAKRIDVQSL